MPSEGRSGEGRGERIGRAARVWVARARESATKSGNRVPDTDKTLMSEDTFCGEDLRTVIENDLGTRVFLDARFRVSRSDSLRATVTTFEYSRVISCRVSMS
jgi:hypothetical protein